MRPVVGLILLLPTLLFAQSLNTEKPVFKYQTGKILLQNGIAELNLPEQYNYIDPTQASFVLEKLWGNPPGDVTLGMIFPKHLSPTDSNAWAVIIQYTEDGYVKDKDADKIKYNKLLKDMQKSIKESNKERIAQGYDSIALVGWAENPYYDKVAKKLYWGKELRFGNDPLHTLNYDVRILGRKGYLVLRVVASLNQLSEVKPYMKELTGSVDFKDGHKYADFNPKLDKVATYGVAALVAGGILAKVGLFKGLLIGIIALKKFLIIGAIAAFAAFKGLFNKKKKEQVRKIDENVKKID